MGQGEKAPWGVPVMTVDGPSASGKSTVSRALAQRLGWHWLNSGMVYRAVAYCVDQAGLAVNAHAVPALVNFIKAECVLDIALSPAQESGCVITWKKQAIIVDLQATLWAEKASLLSAHLPVREALLDLQRQFAREPGLVADGRDMGTVVFPWAGVKFFLEADCMVRAKRRFMQLQRKGIHVSLVGLKKALEERDRRDRMRAVSPLVPAKGACVLDTSLLSQQAVLARMLSEIEGYNNNGHESEGKGS